MSDVLQSLEPRLPNGNGKQRKARVLLVDDEPQVLIALEDLLSDDFVVDKVESAERALNMVESERDIAVILSDQRMPRMNGDELLARAGGICKATRILVTGFADLSAVIRAVNSGKIFAYVTKPWQADALRTIVQKAAEHFRLNQELAYERQLLHELMNNIPDAIFFKDKDLRYVRVNPAFAHYLDTPIEHEINGKRVTELPVDPGLAEVIETEERELLFEGKQVLDRVREVLSPSSRRWFSSTKALMRNSDGEPIGLVGIARDVTQRFEIEQALRVSEERLRLTFEASNAGLFDWDIATNVVTFSPNLAALLDHDTGELAPSLMEVRSRLHPEDESRVERAFAQHLKLRQALRDVEFRARVAGGEFRWFQISGQALWNDQDLPTRMVGSINDISERKEQEVRIARLSRMHAVLSGISSTIVRVHDRETLIQESCRIAVRAGHLALAAVISFVDDEAGAHVAAWHASDDQPPAEKPIDQHSLLEDELLARTIDTQRPVVVNDVTAGTTARLRSELEQHGHRALALFPLFVSGKLRAVLALFAREADFFDSQEVTLLSELADNISFALDHIATTERLDFLANYDAVTRLAKRDLLTDRVDQQLLVCRNDQRKLAVLLLDIGRFRQVNETFGRSGGDRVLALMAQRLKDAVTEENTLARFDSNSFALWIAPDNEADVATWLESAIFPKLTRPFRVGDAELAISVKVGIAVFPSDGADADGLLANAEAALKKAKLSGQRYLFYARSMNERVAEKLSLETKLRRAIERDEFLLHYQPKVDLKTARVVGLEALIRWRDPGSGLVPPGKFIPLLEETGLILDVGRWVLDRAAAQYVSWAEQELAPVRIAVNVSAIQLAQADFIQTLDRVMALHPAAANGIDLEITESVLMEDLSGNIEKLRAAKERGVFVAIDDFGTGYSSLGYLSRLPIDALKVDRSFIMRMADDPQDTMIVTTIISLAHSLELKVIAEGVETAEQARLLRLLRCDQLQGYLAAKPLPAEEVAALLNAKLELGGATRQ